MQSAIQSAWSTTNSCYARGARKGMWMMEEKKHDLTPFVCPSMWTLPQTAETKYPRFSKPSWKHTRLRVRPFLNNAKRIVKGNSSICWMPWGMYPCNQHTQVCINTIQICPQGLLVIGSHFARCCLGRYHRQAVLSWEKRDSMVVKVLRWPGASPSHCVCISFRKCIAMQSVTFVITKEFIRCTSTWHCCVPQNEIDSP